MAQGEEISTREASSSGASRSGASRSEAPRSEAPRSEAHGLPRAATGWDRAAGDRRTTPRRRTESPVLRAVELAPGTIDGRRLEDWSDLARRALEPNPFLEPSFALAALRHFAPDERPRLIGFVDRRGALAAVFPLAPPRLLSSSHGLLRLWRAELAALDTPLVDRDRTQEALDAFLDWVVESSLAAGVLFSRIPAEGAFYAALAAAARRGGRRLEIMDVAARAALRPGGLPDDKCVEAGGRRRLDEIRRQRRRLAERGALAFTMADAPAGVRAATEEFMALEASGWKAGRGAFLCEPGLPTFLRSATRLLAARGGCRIAALRLDGRAVAMAILLESQNRSYLWKIAYDETLRSQAPGVLLAHALTAHQMARGDVELTDSCAIANHAMIERLWPDRVTICNVAVALRHGGFGAALRRAEARQRLRDLAKRAAHRLLSARR